MSQRTFDAATPTGQAPVDPPPPAILAGAVAGVRAAAGSFAVVFVPVIAFWISGSPAQASWQDAVRVALDGWLLGHHVPVQLPHGVLSLTPLGLFAIVLASCWFTGRWLSRILDPRAATVEAVRAGLLRDGRVHPRAKRAVTRSLVLFVVTYSAVASIATGFASSGSGGPHAFPAALAGAFVSLTAGVGGAYAWSHDGLLPGLRAFGRAAGDAGVELVRRFAPQTRFAPSLRRAVPRWIRPAGDALAAVLAGGAVLFLVSLAVHRRPVAEVFSALDAGRLGGAGVILLTLALVPNAVVWGAAFVVGPGFALGAGTAVGPAGSSVDALPTLPLFGAAPAPGTFPGWAWAVLAMPLAAGVLAAIRIIRRRQAERTQLIDAVGSALLAGASFAVLAWLSSGSLGPGRMADFGPNPLLAGAALAAELAVSAVATVVSWQTFRPSR